MNRLFRWSVSLFVSAALCSTLAPAVALAAVDEREPNDSFDTATVIDMGATVYGAADDYDEDFYKVTLPESGAVKLTFTNEKYQDRGWFDLVTYNRHFERDEYTSIYVYTTRPATLNLKLSKGINYIRVCGSWHLSNQPYHFKLAYSIPGTTVKKVTAKKRGFKTTWTRKSGAAKYQVRYSTAKGMSGAKSIEVKGASATVKKLKRKKRYYVQVRVAKTIGGKTYWSGWSSKKSVKTK